MISKTRSSRLVPFLCSALALCAVWPGTSLSAPRKATGILLPLIGDPGSRSSLFDNQSKDAGGIDLVLVAKKKAFNILATTPEDLETLLKMSKGRGKRKRRITLQLKRVRFKRPRQKGEMAAESNAEDSDHLMVTRIMDAGPARVRRQRTASWAIADGDETIRLRNGLRAAAGSPPTAAAQTRRVQPVLINLANCSQPSFPSFKQSIERAYSEWIQASNESMFPDTWDVRNPISLNVARSCTGNCANPAELMNIASAAESQMQAGGLNPNSLYRILYLLPSQCQFSGYAEGGNINQGPKRSWYWRQSFVFSIANPDAVPFIIAHELGHNFGFEHSSVGNIVASPNQAEISVSTAQEYKQGFLMGDPMAPTNFRYTYRGTHLVKPSNQLLPQRSLFDMRNFSTTRTKFTIKLQDVSSGVVTGNAQDPFAPQNVYQGAVIVPPGAADRNTASISLYRLGNRIHASPRLPDGNSFFNDYPWQDFGSSNGSSYLAPNGAWRAKVTGVSGQASELEITLLLADFDSDGHLNAIRVDQDGNAILSGGQLQPVLPPASGQDQCPFGGFGPPSCNSTPTPDPNGTPVYSCNDDDDKDGVWDCEDCCPPPLEQPPAPTPTINTFNPYSWCTNINRGNIPPGEPIRQLCGGQDCRICNPSASPPVQAPPSGSPGTPCEVNCDGDAFVDGRGSVNENGRCNLQSFQEDNCNPFQEVAAVGDLFSNADLSTICSIVENSLPSGVTLGHYRNDDQRNQPCPRPNAGTPSPGTFTPTPTKTFTPTPTHTPTNTPTPVPTPPETPTAPPTPTP